jgi:iron(III) transport system ATP-binding protein
MSKATHAMYRAEDLKLADDTDTTSAITLDFVEASNIAGRVMVTGVSDGLRLTAIVDAAPDLRIGDRVAFRLPEKSAALFAADGKRLA